MKKFFSTEILAITELVTNDTYNFLGEGQMIKRKRKTSMTSQIDPHFQLVSKKLTFSSSQISIAHGLNI